jgi:DNA-binding MarR family transcriptional regulator
MVRQPCQVAEAPGAPPHPVPVLVIQAFAGLVPALVARLHAAGFRDLRSHHFLHVLRFVDCDGTRPSVLAERAGITPQAMSELIGDLEGKGYVRREPDPRDQRSRLVVYAERGLEAAGVVEEFFTALERRVGESVGPEGLVQLDSALAAFLEQVPRVVEDR